jgi:hypothetical protein
MFKTSLLRNQLAISIKLGTSYPRAKGIRFCAYQIPRLLQKGNNKNAKVRCSHLEN